MGKGKAKEFVKFEALPTRHEENKVGGKVVRGEERCIGIEKRVLNPNTPEFERNGSTASLGGR